jgi:hypothetical protein
LTEAGLKKISNIEPEANSDLKTYSYDYASWFKIESDPKAAAECVYGVKEYWIAPCDDSESK